MPVLVVWLLEGLGALLVSSAAKVLFALGVGFVTYTGLDTAMTTLQGYITSSYAGLPTTVAQLAGLMQLDRAVSIIMAAVSARFVLAGITGGGSIKKMIFK